MGEAEKLSGRRSDEPAEANARPRRGTAEEVPSRPPPAEPAGHGTSQGASRDIRGTGASHGASRALRGTGTSHGASRTLGGTATSLDHPGHSGPLRHTGEQHRETPEEHHRTLRGDTPEEHPGTP